MSKPKPENTPSGPVGDAVVADTTEQIPLAHAGAKTKKAQEMAQEDAEAKTVGRSVTVQATRRGYIGDQLREEGTTFELQIKEGESLPSWVTEVE